ncbi:MAG: nucleotidyltransferase family protein [Desulfobacterales bacterium]|nr:nucleotidyltransferase family protein [Desulfobacterales bacterium]
MLQYIENITPVILSGGRGSRLHAIVSDRSKVMAVVRGRPFITYIMDQLIEAGFKQVILCVGYLADTMIETLGYEYRNLSIQYSQEAHALGTGGAVKYAMPLIETRGILVMNGDSFIDIDLNDFLSWHLEKKFDVSIVLSEVSDVSRYGAVTINNNQAITDFEEKSAKNRPGWVNAGIYLFLRKLIEESIQPDVFYSLEKDLMPVLLKKIPIGGYCCKSKLIDIGTPESYKAANRVSSE